MRTAVLSLGLALLCYLHAEAEELGAAGLDKSEVIPGEGEAGAGSLINSVGTGEVFW